MDKCDDKILPKRIITSYYNETKLYSILKSFAQTHYAKPPERTATFTNSSQHKSPTTCV